MFNENIEATKKAISERKTIFEAGIKTGDFFIRADLLEPESNGWNLCEIKSSTEVKPEHIPDLAYQKFVCEKAGLKINKCFVLFLNIVLAISLVIPMVIIIHDMADTEVGICENRTGIVSSCEVIDYKWYQPHQCYTIDCDTNITYINTSDLI